MEGPEWPKWREAILTEQKALEAHETWVLEKPPPGTNIVGLTWVFRWKLDANGVVTKYKARLVAQGFSQIPGIHFLNNYVPVAKLATI